MRGCYIGNNRVLVSLTWGGKMIVNSNDLSISPDLIIHGVYDIPLTNFMINHVKPGQVFIDVGANMGLFTILAGYLVGEKGRVISFEANPKHYELIKENLAMNYLSQRALVFQAAVYSEETQLTFHATEKFMGNGSLIEHDEHYKGRYLVDSFSTYKVDAVPLDAVLADMNYVDFIKIDIEGGEYHAFLGLQERLRSKAVGTVIFELNKRMLRENWFPFYNRLQEYHDEFGYRFHTLNQEGNLVPVELDHLFRADEVPAVVMTIR